MKMKTRSCSCKTITVILLAAILVSLWSATATAEDLNMFAGMEPSACAKTNGVYLNGNAGIAIMQNMTAPGEVIQYHVGPRADLAVGYDITENIAVELQGGFANNSWSSVPPNASADVWTVPVMANGIYNYSYNTHLQAYAGLGAGAVLSILDISTPKANSVSSDWTFGYQAMFGIKYIFSEHMEWGLGYNFLGSLDHHWNDLGKGIRTSPTYMHSILLSLTYRF
jgi:opacity protein-like surface antigen